MRIPDDDQQFASELRRFVPREVAPLPQTRAVRWRWSWRWSLSMSAAAVLLAMMGTILWHTGGTSRMVVVSQSDVSAQEVTLGRAQAALAQAPSFEEAIDRLERTSRPVMKAPAVKAKDHKNQSALEALGKEEL